MSALLEAPNDQRTNAQDVYDRWRTLEEQYSREFSDDEWLEGDIRCQGSRASLELVLKHPGRVLPSRGGWAMMPDYPMPFRTGPERSSISAMAMLYERVLPKLTNPALAAVERTIFERARVHGLRYRAIPILEH